MFILHTLVGSLFIGIMVMLLSPHLYRWFKRKPVVTPEMYEIGVALGDNAERIHEVVAAWEQEKDTQTRQHIIEPMMKTLFTMRHGLQNQIEALRRMEEVRRATMALTR